jgi:hypothetical protein
MKKGNDAERRKIMTAQTRGRASEERAEGKRAALKRGVAGIQSVMILKSSSNICLVPRSVTLFLQKYQRCRFNTKRVVVCQPASFISH